MVGHTVIGLMGWHGSSVVFISNQYKSPTRARPSSSDLHVPRAAKTTLDCCQHGHVPHVQMRIFETIDMCEAACVGSVSSVLMTGSAVHMMYSLRSDGLSSKYESLSEAIVSAQLLRAGISDVCGE